MRGLAGFHSASTTSTDRLEAEAPAKDQLSLHTYKSDGGGEEVMVSVELAAPRRSANGTLREDAEGLPELLVGRGRIGPRGGEDLKK